MTVDNFGTIIGQVSIDASVTNESSGTWDISGTNTLNGAGSVLKNLGTINHGNTGGGTNWPGGGLDPETHIFYSQANVSGVTFHTGASGNASRLGRWRFATATRELAIASMDMSS